MLEKVRAEEKRLMQLQPEVGFRESYRIQGETVITADDYTTGRVFDDAVCFAFYPVDLHTKSGVKPKPLAQGIVPTIPLSALVPKGSRHMFIRENKARPLLCYIPFHIAHAPLQAKDSDLESVQMRAVPSSAVVGK